MTSCFKYRPLRLRSFTWKALRELRENRTAYFPHSSLIKTWYMMIEFKEIFTLWFMIFTSSNSSYKQQVAVRVLLTEQRYWKMFEKGSIFLVSLLLLKKSDRIFL